jgi:hypothetical protein
VGIAPPVPWWGQGTWRMSTRCTRCTVWVRKPASRTRRRPSTTAALVCNEPRPLTVLGANTAVPAPRSWAMCAPATGHPPHLLPLHCLLGGQKPGLGLGLGLGPAAKLLGCLRCVFWGTLPPCVPINRRWCTLRTCGTQTPPPCGAEVTARRLTPEQFAHFGSGCNKVVH